MSRIALVVGCCLLALPLVSAGRPETAKTDSSASKEDKPTAEVLAAAKGNNEFAAALYARLAKNAKASENLALSPYSISAALAMTYAGARGETAAEMSKVLRFDADQDKFHPAFAAFTRRLSGTGKDGDEGLLVANAVWLAKSLEVKKPYAEVLQKHHAAGLRRADFKGDPEAARKEINAWVSEKTKKHIPEVLKQGAVSSATQMALANALYFKGKWEIPFDPKETKTENFHVTKTEKVKTPMMRLVAKVRHTEGPDCQVVEVPYAGGRYSMLVILPDSLDALSEVEANLGNLGDWVAKLKTNHVTLSLPRFALEARFELSDVLSKMGMARAFGGADFSGAASGLRISAVHHVAKVVSDEEGTTAAAATVVIKSVSKKPVMRCDRPFLVVVREVSTGAVLFVGRVCRPATPEAARDKAAR